MHHLWIKLVLAYDLNYYLSVSLFIVIYKCLPTFKIVFPNINNNKNWLYYTNYILIYKYCKIIHKNCNFVIFLRLDNGMWSVICTITIFQNFKISVSYYLIITCEK